MYISKFIITKMDCPSEESMIRMKLENLEVIRDLQFDIPKRILEVYHDKEEDAKAIGNELDSLLLGSKKKETRALSSQELSAWQNQMESSGGGDKESSQRKILRIVLGINLAFFVIEMATGIFSHSMALVADSLDMLADAFVYGISLLAVGSTVVKKKKVARIAGWFQITLAILGILEVVRRFLGMEELPDFRFMLVVGSLALIANVTCLLLLLKTKSDEAHMRASVIFSSNDVVANIGVLIAASLVNYLESGIPDLVVGSIVFLVVLRGAVSILRLSR